MSITTDYFLPNNSAVVQINQVRVNNIANLYSKTSAVASTGTLVKGDFSDKYTLDFFNNSTLAPLCYVDSISIRLRAREVDTGSDSSPTDITIFFELYNTVKGISIDSPVGTLLTTSYAEYTLTLNNFLLTTDQLLSGEVKIAFAVSNDDDDGRADIDYVEVAVEYTSPLKYWNGSNWIDSAIRRRTASDWVYEPLRYKSALPIGEATYTTPGTYNWVCPPGVNSVSVVCIGAGGSGYATQSFASSGGGGGGLGWKNNISVTPGQSYTVVVGQGGTSANNFSVDGGDSYFINTSTVAGFGGGRSRVTTGGTVSGGSGGSFVGDGGGNGGNGGTGYESGETERYGGGGGAGGYSGNGGRGGNGSSSGTSDPTSGVGGGGAGGSSGVPNSGADGGGGVGIYGEGPSGIAAEESGSYGLDGKTDGGGGDFGGGGGGVHFGGQRAGHGAVRIIWGPNRAFPSTNTRPILNTF